MKNECKRCICLLGDKTRINIYQSINQKPKYVSEIQQLFKLGQPTISYHLKVLSSRGLIFKTEMGRNSLYSVSTNCPYYNKLCVLKPILK